MKCFLTFCHPREGGGPVHNTCAALPRSSWIPDVSACLTAGLGDDMGCWGEGGKSINMGKAWVRLLARLGIFGQDGREIPDVRKVCP